MYVCMYVSSPEGGDEQRHTYPDRKVPRDKTTFRNDRTLFARSAGSKSKSESQRMECRDVQLGTFPL